MGNTGITNNSLQQMSQNIKEAFHAKIGPRSISF